MTVTPGIKRVFITSDGLTFQSKAAALGHEAVGGRLALAHRILHEHFPDGEKATITRFMRMLAMGERLSNIEVVRQSLALLEADVPRELLADTVEDAADA
jgi:hypothetical protein